MTKQIIQFHKTMGPYKRNDYTGVRNNNAHLILNALNTKNEGLYPASSMNNFNESIGSNGYTIKQILGSNASWDTYMVTEKDGNVYFDTVNDATPDTEISDHSFVWGTYGQHGHRLLMDNGDIFDGNGNQKSTLPTGHTSPKYVLYDGLHYYYFTQDKIYRQIDDEEPVIAFDGLPYDIDYAFVYGDEIVIVKWNGRDVWLYFWDKDDNTLFTKRVKVENIKPLGVGVVANKMVALYGVGNATNPKEKGGDLTLGVWNGQFFEPVNTVELPKIYENYKHYHFSTGNGVMVARLEASSSQQPTLGKTWIVKVSSDYKIQFIDYEKLEGDNSGWDRTYEGIHVGYEEIYVWGKAKQVPTSSKQAFVWSNHQTDKDFDDYYSNYNETQYITELFQDTKYKYELDELNISFEQLFEQNREELEIYWRDSTREQKGETNWKLLGVINTEMISKKSHSKRDKTLSETERNDDNKGLGVQNWKFTFKGKDKPIYHEIQFKLVSKAGFSIITADYEYTRQKRD